MLFLLHSRNEFYFYEYSDQELKLNSLYAVYRKQHKDIRGYVIP